MQPPSLQEAVDRYALSLAVPDYLSRLHGRRRGNPGHAAALAPAVVLTCISAFEGFVEEFLAIAAAHMGRSFGQIAHIATMNNPTVKTFEDKLGNLLGWPPAVAVWKTSFEISIWEPPTISGSAWHKKKKIDWQQAKDDSDAWMEVRHCITHGLVRGFRPEVWPGPLKGTVQARSVLKPKANGKHSLTIHGAESCGHIHRQAAAVLADAAVQFIGKPPLIWEKVPDFDL